MSVSLPPGCLIRHYRVNAFIARGGEGAVYKATDMRTGRAVALKQFHFLASDRSESEALARARRHELLISLSCPYVVQILDAFLHSDGFYYVVMEYLDGDTLFQLCERVSPLDLRMVHLFASDVLRGLAYLHDNGVIHRDIKPENFSFVGSGCELHAVIVDLGVAHHTKPSRITTKDPPCTLLYAAPELLLHGSVRPESDLFSLGIVVYEALTGRHPCGELSPSEAYFKCLRAGDFPDVADLRDDVPLGVSDWVRSMLSWDASERPQSAALALQALEAAFGVGVAPVKNPVTAGKAAAPIRAPEPFGPHLLVMTGTYAGKVVQVPAGGQCLGRISLDPEDARISRIHVRAKPVRRGMRLTDLASSNGLIYQGRRARRVTLRHGEEVNIGSTTVRFENPSG